MFRTFLSMLALAALAACSQATAPATAQALPLAFDFSEPAPKGVIERGADPLTAENASDYIGFFEYYFQLRFSDSDGTAFLDLIAGKWRTEPDFRTALRSTAEVYRAVRAMPYPDAARLRVEKRSAGAMEQALLNGIGAGGPAPTEPYNQIVALAQSGEAEASWLLERIDAAERPLAPATNMLARPLTRRQVDALIDLLVFRANAVAGERRLAATEDMRDQMADYLVDAWTADASQQPDLFLWLTGAQADWQAIAHADRRWPTGPMTPYQANRTLRDWAVQTKAWFPELSDAADRRIQAYTNYVRGMSAEEMAMELGVAANAAQVAQASVAALQRQIEASHVVNLNAIEGLGGGREWSYRLVKRKEVLR